MNYDVSAWSLKANGVSQFADILFSENTELGVAGQLKGNYMFTRFNPAAQGSSVYNTS